MIFTTKQGQHYSDQLLYKIANCINNTNRLAFVVTFTNSCAYTLPKEDQEALNRIRQRLQSMGKIEKTPTTYTSSTEPRKKRKLEYEVR